MKEEHCFKCDSKLGPTEDYQVWNKEAKAYKQLCENCLKITKLSLKSDSIKD